MATTEEIRAGLAELVNEVTGIPADDVQLDKSFVADLDVDSLSMVEVVVAAEEKFGVSIPDSEVKNLKTVAWRDDACRWRRGRHLECALSGPHWCSPARAPMGRGAANAHWCTRPS